MRIEIMNQLETNSGYIDQLFPGDDNGFAQWARSQSRAAIEFYRANDHETTVNALAICVSQLLIIIQNYEKNKLTIRP